MLIKANITAIAINLRFLFLAAETLETPANLYTQQNLFPVLVSTP